LHSVLLGLERSNYGKLNIKNQSAEHEKHEIMTKSIKTSLIVFFLCLTSFGQTTTTPNTPQKATDPNETIIKYEEFLREETKLHREYTQKYYDMIWGLLGALGIIVGAVLTWLNWKSKKDIKKQINDQFKRTVQSLLDEKLKQIDNLIKDGKEKSAKQFEDIGRIILELSEKSEKIKVQGQTEVEAEEKSDVNRLKGKTILWVDDYPVNNEYPMRILSNAGIKFSLALDTEEAINILKKQKFDLIISDMGRGSNYSAGLDLLKELKLLKIETPVIIYASTKALDGFGNEALKLGAIAITTGVTRVLNIVQKVLLVK